MGGGEALTTSSSKSFAAVSMSTATRGINVVRGVSEETGDN